MCDGHAHGSGAAGHALSRRHVLQGMVSLAALAACGTDERARRAVPLVPRSAGATGLTPYVLAMHLHASACEGVGSVRSHLAEAAANGFDVAWFTEHDGFRHRMFRRTRYSFVPEDAEKGGVWRIPPLPPVGSLAAGSGGELVSTPTSPNDRATPKGSLRLRATSTDGGRAAVGHRIDSESDSVMNLRGRILGLAVSLDVLPNRSGPGAWGQVFFGLSYHPASGDRPAGKVSVLYRLRSDVSRRAVTRNGATAIVDVPVTNGEWQTVVFRLSHDLHEAWPDLETDDNSLHEMQFHASSQGQAPADFYFGCLRFTQQQYDAVGVERALLAAYADQEPDVLGLIGTELSVGPHINQYGGPQSPYDYGSVRSLDDRTGDIRRSLVDFIHRQGGLASINHPFLPSEPWTATSPSGVARDLLAIGAGGADILEVGYGGPGHLPDHFAVWDTLARNGLFLTGNGVSDDHEGQNWSGLEGRFYTATWAPRLTEFDLLRALARGRAYVGYLGSFGGTLDMTLDGDVPMGAVSVDPRRSRGLHIDVTGLPDGGAVEVVRGVVDLAGTRDPTPNTAVLTTLGARDLDSHGEIPIDTGDECFVRLQVRDAAGGVVAFGQPIWALKDTPPRGIPPTRLVPG